MRRRFRAWPGLLAAACLTALSAHAQPANAEHPLHRGFDAAWTRQPELRALPLRRDAADAARRAAQRWTADAPALELAGRTDRFNTNAGAHEHEATVALPLWLPGERAGARAVADAQADALGAQLVAVRLALAEQVRAAYWAQARAAQDTQLAEARLRSARSLADDVARRLKAGDLSRADAHQAEGAVAAAESKAAEQRAAGARAARTWHMLTGIAPSGDGDAPPEAIPPDGAAPVLHPTLRELSAKVETARRQRELARTQRWANPELALGTVRERGATGERHEQSVTVGLRIPLGTTSASAARIAAAGADQLEAEALLERETRRIASDVASAREDVDALRAAADAAERRARLARESRGFFEKSFRMGESDLPTRLRIDLEAFEAERQALRARLELSAAISSLRQTLGLLPE